MIDRPRNLSRFSRGPQSREEGHHGFRPAGYARHVLKAATEYERQGSRRVLPELEALEPDLAEFLLEKLTRLYHQLAQLGFPDADARRAYRLAKKTAVVCVMAQRQAHRDLWGWDEGGLPPPEEPPGPPRGEEPGPPT